jgi:hypothetical protein
MSSPVAFRTRGEASFLHPGTPTDRDPRIVAAGNCDVTIAQVNLGARSPTGEDAEYIRWHQFDHVPEQFRIQQIRNGQRWVSTPACRAARRAQTEPFDRVDHVVQYLFAEPVGEGLAAFAALSRALIEAGRQPKVVPRVQVGAFEVIDRRSNPRAITGAQVLPWWPASGVYLVIEPMPGDEAARAEHAEALGRLVTVDGVAGAWRYESGEREFPTISRHPGQSMTVFYLYEDPVGVAGPLGDALAREWAAAGTEAWLAAPFHIVRPHAWDHHLP